MAMKPMQSESPALRELMILTASLPFSHVKSDLNIIDIPRSIPNIGRGIFYKKQAAIFQAADNRWKTHFFLSLTIKTALPVNGSMNEATVPLGTRVTPWRYRPASPVW